MWFIMGDIGITHLAALAGVPQLIVHRGPERWFNARAVWKTGAGGGRAANGKNVDEIAKLTHSIFRNNSYKHAALNWADGSFKWIGGRRGQDVIADRVFNALNVG